MRVQHCVGDGAVELDLPNGQQGGVVALRTDGRARINDVNGGRHGAVLRMVTLTS